MAALSTPSTPIGQNIVQSSEPPAIKEYDPLEDALKNLESVPQNECGSPLNVKKRAFENPENVPVNHDSSLEKGTKSLKRKAHQIKKTCPLNLDDNRKRMNFVKSGAWEAAEKDAKEKFEPNGAQ
tara:strand:- start:254 stop:628 length:375 start_codon:yes stop_codon:yes gene_type:complete